MNTRELSTAKKVVFGAGLFLLFNLFTPWYRQGGFFSTGFGADAYDAGFLAWFGSWCGTAAAVVIAGGWREIASCLVESR